MQSDIPPIVLAVFFIIFLAGCSSLEHQQDGQEKQFDEFIPAAELAVPPGL